MLPIVGITLTLIGYIFLTFQTFKLNEKKTSLQGELQQLEPKKKELEAEIKELEAIKTRLTIETKKRDTIISLQENIISQSSDQRTIQSGVKLMKLIKEPSSTFFTVTKKENANIDLAQKFESEGFNYLFNKEVNQAIISFRKSENSSNGYHQVYEIANYLDRNRSKLADKKSVFWKEAYRKILKDFTWRMPKEIKVRLTGSAK